MRREQQRVEVGGEGRRHRHVRCDAAYLAQYSGVHDASDTDLAALDARSAARASSAEASRGLSRNNVAALLGVNPLNRGRGRHGSTQGSTTHDSLLTNEYVIRVVYAV